MIYGKSIGCLSINHSYYSVATDCDDAKASFGVATDYVNAKRSFGTFNYLYDLVK